MFYSNFNGREDFPCEKRLSPKTEYDTESDTPKEDQKFENNT